MAPNMFRDFHPSTDDTWIIGKIFFYFDGQLYKVSDVVDARTRFLLASSMTLTHDISTVTTIMREASIKAGKYPRSVFAHMHYSYFLKIKNAFTCEAEHMHNQLSALEYNIEMVECYNAVFKPRGIIMHTFKSPSAIRTFLDGWFVFYNFFQPQPILGYLTPAQVAGINYPIKSWKDLAAIHR